jgi:hypothetical protein
MSPSRPRTLYPSYSCWPGSRMHNWERYSASGRTPHWFPGPQRKDKWKPLELPPPAKTLSKTHAICVEELQQEAEKWKMVIPCPNPIRLIYLGGAEDKWIYRMTTDHCGLKQEDSGSPVQVPHTCNPSYLGGWDWKDHGSRPAWANTS